jgi:hypothetical protein
MSLDPVLPAAILLTIAATLLAARLVALRSVLQTRRPLAVLRWCGLTLVVLLVVGAGFRPAVDIGTAPADTAADVNVFLVVDRSVGPEALAGVRADVTALLDAYPRGRYAVIGSGARAALDWPLSADVWSLRPVVAALTPQPAVDTDAGAASNLLRYQAIQAAQQYPRSTTVVMYYGNGAPGSQAPQSTFDVPGIGRGLVLGYGAVDAARLRDIATQLGVPYAQRAPGAPAAQAVPSLTARASAAAPPAARRELYWALAMAAAVLLLAEVFTAVREYRQSRIARREVAR